MIPEPRRPRSLSPPLKAPSKVTKRSKPNAPSKLKLVIKLPPKPPAAVKPELPTPPRTMSSEDSKRTPSDDGAVTGKHAPTKSSMRTPSVQSKLTTSPLAFVLAANEVTEVEAEPKLEGSKQRKLEELNAAELVAIQALQELRTERRCMVGLDAFINAGWIFVGVQ